MERENRLSQNLSAIRNALYPKTLSEIADEIHISKSTLQSAIATGNVNLDTAIRIANALHISLDTLVFGTLESRKVNFLQQQLRVFSWYVLLPPNKQKQFLYHLSELLKLLGNAE